MKNLHQKAGLLCFCGLIVLCSGLSSGCAAAPLLAPAFVSLCPAPATPVLPELQAEALESETNTRILLVRDDITRNFIKGQQATITCYESQFDGHIKNE